MAKMDQTQQPRTGGMTYVETPAQVAAWKLLRSYMREQGISAGDTFTVQGTIAKILLDGPDSAPRYFTKKVTDDKGVEKDWPFVKVLAAITDPRFGAPGTLDFPAKNVGASYFDGVTKRGRSPNRGGMYNLHVAVTGQEPSQALKDGKGDWDTEDYENKPILLRLEYQGKEEPDSAYADRRLGMKIFIAGFEKDRSVHRATDLDDDEEDAPFDVPPGRTLEEASNSGISPGRFAPTPAAAEATKAADLSVLPATDRQVRFMYALAKEAGMDEREANQWSMEQHGERFDLLTRKEASDVIDALQRQRNPQVEPPPEAPEPPKLADPTHQRATERQVKFIYAIGREAGLDATELTSWAQELYARDVDQLNRRDASTLIEALQRRRNDLPEPVDGITEAMKRIHNASEGKDELVSVGVSTRKPTPPEDDSDLNF